jgi:predicted alpha/beta superfamily hydrolase
MQHLNFALILLLSLLYSISGLSQKKAVELPGTEVKNLTSSIDSQQYVLYIKLPDNYDNTRKNYPVVYVTDGQWCFPSMYVAYGGQRYDGLVPDMIIVGITWPGDYDVSRAKDFTPTRVNFIPNSGNAPKFLSTLKNDIVKFVDSSYRTDKNERSLYGTSLGGLFAIYSLFHEPKLFKRYIVISPALFYDNEILLNYERQFARQNRQLNARVFISSGEYEEVLLSGNYFNRFLKQLNESKYAGLELESMIIPRMSHGGSGAAGAILGLQSIFKRAELTVADTVLLSQYAGRYAANQDTSLITKEMNSIYFHYPPFGKGKLYLDTHERFYVKGINTTIQFIKDVAGKITGYKRLDNDAEFFYKKVD